MFLRLARVLAIAAGIAVVASATAAGTDRIEIDYDPPTKAEHAALAKRLQKHRVLEQLREYLSPFRFPNTLTLRLRSCHSPNAWYDDGVVSVCYEYIDNLVHTAPQEPLAPGLSRADAVIGPTMEVFLHETAHALFEMLKIPVLGREEDAADQVAAYMLLNLSKDEARRAVLGTASMYLREARTFTAADIKDFADPHPVPAQRYFNLLCLAYGADQQLFADTVGQNVLPSERAEDCAGEYAQVSYAFRTLIGPHLDPERLQLVQSRRWLDFDTAVSTHDVPLRSKTKP